jgi:hypothetical protein
VKTDAQLKADVTDGLKWDAAIFASAEQRIRPLAAVRGLSNESTIRNRVTGQGIANRIRAALTAKKLAVH